MNLKKIIAIAGALALSAGALSACSSPTTPTSTAPPTSATASAADLAKPITIGVGAKVGSFLLPFFAESQGLFEAEGLTDVTVSIVPGPQLPSGLAGGAVNVGVLGAPAVDIGALNGPVKIVGTWQTEPGVQLLGGPGISSVEDLKGKKIAINGGKAGLASFMVGYALREAGLKESDVQLVVLADYPSQLQAFGSGQADATIAAPPFTDQLIEQRPGSSVLREYDDVIFPTPELVVNTDWASANRGQAEALIRALEAARASWLSDPALAKAVLAEQFNAPVDSAAVTSTYDATVKTFLPELVPVTLEMEQRVFELARDSGFPTATDEAAADVIDESYVTAALSGK